MENSSSKSELVDEEGRKFGVSFGGKSKGGGRTSFFIIGAICFIAIACLCAGIVLLAKTKSCKDDSKAGTSSATTGKSTLKEQCKFSDEAKRIGLETFLKKVKDTYYRVHPENAAWHPDATTDRIRKEYRAYDPTPAKIKERTDAAITLLNEINAKVSATVNLLLCIL